MKRNTIQLKENLIQAGIDEIRQHGIDMLSLRTIAKSCGVTHGTPYRHFESKESYLKVVLSRLSVFLSDEINKGIELETSAAEQLIQIGFNLIEFAKNYPYYFETISPDSDLPGFNTFKYIVLKLRKEENFNNSEAESLLHFWSFISGLAIISNSPIGTDLDNETVLTTIRHMLDIYIKGEKL